jgi:hypothetical protein
MSFESPGALWGLASLVLLILFSLWRQGAQRVTVPSLLLWKRIPERNPPIRALRRPRWRLELLAQALAITAAVLALAGPYRESQELKSRRVALVFDTSARLRAGGRLEEFKRIAERLVQGPLRSDEVTCYAASPYPRSFAEVGKVAPVDVHVDLEPLLAAARPGADHVVLFSDRPRDGVDLALLAGPPDNVGIVEFNATSTEVFVRLVNHGPPRPIPLVLDTGVRRIRETLPAGRLVWFRRGDFSKASNVRVSLEGGDRFPLDDVVEAVRLGDPATSVSLAGRLPPQLVKALRSIPGVSLRMGEGVADVAIGVDAPPGPGKVRVWLISARASTSDKVVTVAPHTVTADLEKFARELASVVGELGPADQAGEPLLRVGGKVAAALRGSSLRLAVDVDEWGKGLPSLPIFFANVVEFARSGSSGFVVPRTGSPLLVPPGSKILTAPEGAVVSLSPEGWLVAHTAGEYGLETPAGPRSIRMNLLDERESDAAGMSHPLDWDPASPVGRQPVRRSWAGVAAAAALACLLGAWFMQLRGE